MKILSFRLPLVGALLLPALAAPALAQSGADEGKPDYNVLIGAGPRIAPTYPGSGEREWSAFPSIEVWEADTPFPVEAADEGIGPILFGERLGTGAGVTLAIAPTRSRDDVPGLGKVGFGVEAGAFAQTFLGQNLRLRGEVRQAIGSHKGLVADLMADAVLRGRDDRFVIAAGPRVRWATDGTIAACSAWTRPRQPRAALPPTARGAAFMPTARRPTPMCSSGPGSASIPTPGTTGW